MLGYSDFRRVGACTHAAELDGLNLFRVGASTHPTIGFSKSATTDEIAEHGHVLTPGRYVGAEEVEDDDEPFEEKMERLTGKLQEQFAESQELEKAIRSNLEGLGFGG